MKKLNIYCDMDGVLADFDKEPNAVARFAVEKGFFKGLDPIEENLQALKTLSKTHNVYILSASPNAQADKDKKSWLYRHARWLKRNNIIIMRNGQNKADFAKTDDGILFDDYGKNCREWVASGRVAHKVGAVSVAEWVRVLGL